MIYSQILESIITEYPIILDLSYCENFISKIQERLELLYANFHPLTHISLSERAQMSKSYIERVDRICQDISDALQKAPNNIYNIQSRAELSVPLLKHIEDSIKYFKLPVQHLLEDIKSLKGLDKAKQEYEAVLEQVKKTRTRNCDAVLVQMADLVKNSIDAQLDVETMFDPIIKMSNIIKNKGKKLLSDDKREDFTVLLQYVNLFTRPDFIPQQLKQLENIEDLVQAVLHLQSIRKLCLELYKQPQYKIGFEDLNFIEGDDLLKTVTKWKNSLRDIDNLKRRSEFSHAMSNLSGKE